MNLTNPKNPMNLLNPMNLSDRGVGTRTGKPRDVALG